MKVREYMNLLSEFDPESEMVNRIYLSNNSFHLIAEPKYENLFKCGKDIYEIDIDNCHRSSKKMVIVG
jgi:hypothetical protein